MGCDIHLCVEMKVDDEWILYSQPRVDRNYDLFAMMANVRNNGDIEPLSSPRGLPHDVSKSTACIAKSWGSDGHSHSWLGYEEIRLVLKWARAAKCCGEYNNDLYFFDHSIDDKDHWPSFVQNVRWVFFFDN